MENEKLNDMRDIKQEIISHYSFEQLERISESIAKSGLFQNINSKEKALTLMMLCQSEGLHPMQALKRYNIIQNRPALKADAMLADFQNHGGIVMWDKYNDEEVTATFTHPNKTRITITWTIERASKIFQTTRDEKGNFVKISLAEKDNWKNYKREMMRARVISEGIRTIMPEVVVGMYTPEEISDFTDISAVPINIKPEKSIQLVEPKEKILPVVIESKPDVNVKLLQEENKKPIKNETEKKIDILKKEVDDEPKRIVSKKQISEEINKELNSLRKKLGEVAFIDVLIDNGYKTIRDIKSIKAAEELIIKFKNRKKDDNV